MHVITQDNFGGSDVLRLEERPTPAPGKGELRVRVTAAGVNPVDAEVREGSYRPLGEPPFVLGWDVAGWVEAVGEGVTNFAVGDRVFGMPMFPEQVAAYATHVVAPAAGFAMIPPGLTDAEAGALPIVGLTAWQALVKHGRLQPGQRVLIHSGAGGFGHIAVQIALALGAQVTATTSSGKMDFVRSLGAVQVFDYAREQPGGDFDLVVDPQSGEQAFASLAATRDGGRVIVLNSPPDAVFEAARARGIECEFIIVEPDPVGLAQLCALFLRGALKITVARRFPLPEARAAQDFLATARPIGKVILEP